MSLRAKDIMQSRVLTVRPQMTLAELVDFLISHRVSGVPVVERGKVVGIVSRSDLVRSVSLEPSLAGIVSRPVDPEFAPGEDDDSPQLPRNVLDGLQNRKVRDIMVPEPVAVSPDTPVEDVAKLLVANHMHRVLVTEGAKLCGVISSLDVVRLLAEGRVS